MRNRLHRGYTYVAVLGAAMIASMCVLAGMHVARVELRGCQLGNDLQRAQWLAQSAVEHAVATMRSNSSWRTTFTNNTRGFLWQDGVESFEWKLVDADGSLAGDTTERVEIQGTGRCRNAVWVHRAVARPDTGIPLEALNTTIHASGQITIPQSMTLQASGAPVSTDGTLQVDGTLVGDAQAVVRTGSGTISGTTTVPASRKGMPKSSIFSDYVARATVMPYAGNINCVTLAPGVNEYSGGLNPDGVYYLDTGGNALRIQRLRLLGTLIISSGTQWVTIENAQSMRASREDFPVLIVKGPCRLWMNGTGGDQYLSESALGHNFNPAGAPYQGKTNADLTDVYPSEIRGLIHVMGNVDVAGTGNYRGCLIVHGTVTVNNTPRFFHDRNLIYNPPWGYSSNPAGTEMILQARSAARLPGP